MEEVEGLDQYLRVGLKRLCQSQDSPKDPCSSTLASSEAVTSAESLLRQSLLAKMLINGEGQEVQQGPSGEMQ